MKASRVWTEADDGFIQDWTCETMLINPPGGLVKKAWRKLCSELRTGRVRSGVWVGFSVEQLCILADPSKMFEERFETTAERLERGAWWPMDFDVCVLRKRISFVKEDGSEGSPSHGNYLISFGADPDRFRRYFSAMGQITSGPLDRAYLNRLKEAEDQ